MAFGKRKTTTRRQLRRAMPMSDASAPSRQWRARRPVRHRRLRRPVGRDGGPARPRLGADPDARGRPGAGRAHREGVPSAVWVVTPNGRFTDRRLRRAQDRGAVARGGHRAGRLAAQGRRPGQHRGRPVGPRGGRRRAGGEEQAGVVRFIGVDGYRWMIRCVVNGPQDNVEALAEEARNALADTVVRRGETPLPVRTPLPVQLPEPMAANCAPPLHRPPAAAGRRKQQQPPPPQPAARRSEQGRPCSSCGPSPAARTLAPSKQRRSRHARAAAPPGRRPSRRA